MLKVLFPFSPEGRKREKESSKKSKIEVEEKTTKGGSTSPARKKHKSEIQLAAEQAASTSGTQEASLDMPVDPNEPTYCICHQVSYGQVKFIDLFILIPHLDKHRPLPDLLITHS